MQAGGKNIRLQLGLARLKSVEFNDFTQTINIREPYAAKTLSIQAGFPWTKS